MQITKQDIEHMPQRYRAAFINGLSGAKSANLIGTCNDAKQTNLAMVSSVFHIGANPPLMGVIFRPNSVPRHSFENILAHKWFTINHVNTAIVRQAHQTSARYDEDTSEFEVTGLSEQWIDSIPVPFVQESSIKLALKLVEYQHLSINNTELVIGEIQHIITPDNVINDDGSINFSDTDIVAVTGLDTYHKLTKVTRLSYAKPNQDLHELE
jgi:flavin reductase (DIM6/NTAB) family NADH-FMN oxidoreductase RutF